MLLELSVRDFGIIDNTCWYPQAGFNVITGETGAGKSLVIDAVEALLGGKVDSDAIRYGCDEAVIEGIFAVPNNENGAAVSELVAEKGIALEDDVLIIRCTIRKNGRTVYRLNADTVPRSVVHQIGRLLVDIHSQSEHLSLLERKFQLEFLDAFGGIRELRQQFADRATDLRYIEKQLAELNRQTYDRERREDFLTYQIQEIRQAQLREAEEEELEQERQIIAATEKLRELAFVVHQSIAAEDSRLGSIVDRLYQANRSLKELAGMDHRLAEQTGLFEESVRNIEEIVRDVYSYGDELEYDPVRLNEIESRLELIRNLKRKYGSTIEDIIKFLEQAESELMGLSNSTRTQLEMESRREALRQEMGRIALELSEKRQYTAKELASAVRKELGDLNMSRMKFDVVIHPVEGGEAIPVDETRTRSFNNDGIDVVEFVASTNPGESLKPLAKIASTGEISRFMLALKGALSQADDIPVVVFDEIDVGVGGRSGQTLGKKLWALGRNRQVICITHLPQIAAFADAHFGVHKQPENDRTISILKELDDKSQIEELTAMLAGPEFAKSAIKNAKDILRKAKSWKESCSGVD